MEKDKEGFELNGAGVRLANQANIRHALTRMNYRGDFPTATSIPSHRRARITEIRKQQTSQYRLAIDSRFGFLPTRDLLGDILLVVSQRMESQRVEQKIREEDERAEMLCAGLERDSKGRLALNESSFWKILKRANISLVFDPNRSGPSVTIHKNGSKWGTLSTHSAAERLDNAINRRVGKFYYRNEEDRAVELIEAWLKERAESVKIFG